MKFWPWLAAESLLVALAFFVMSALHFGLHLGPLSDQPIPVGAYVEAACGAALAIAFVALVAGITWRWPAAVGAHAFAILAVLLGIFATRLGTTELNFAYHRLILVVLVLGLLALLTRPGRALGATA